MRVALCAVLAALLLALGGHATCAGNGCSEQQAAARSAGLLGDAASCQPKTYPFTGTLQPVNLPTPVVDIRWAAFPNGTANEQFVFALTTDEDGYAGGPLWRSASAGAAASWKDTSAELSAALPAEARPPPPEPGPGVVAVFWHDAEPARLFLQGRGGYHFTSEDYGQTFVAVRAPGGGDGGYAQEFKLHPRQAKWLLARARREGCGEAAQRAALCPYDLFVTQDWGTTWANLTDASKGRVASFRDFEWGAKLEKYAGKPTPDEAIFATLYPTGRGERSLYPGWSADVHYAVSLDFFASPADRMLPCGNLFEILAHKVYVAAPSDCPVGPDGKPRPAPARAVSGRTVTLYVSDGDGDDFREACLPANLEDDGYNMVRTHDGWGTFVLADHAEPGSRSSSSDAPTSDAYAPAYNASLFTLSLRDVYRREFTADFGRVEALPGVYLANQVDVAALDPAARVQRSQFAKFLRTRISLNGGSDWAALSPPPSFRYAQCNTCRGGGAACALHLHGPSSWTAPEGPHPSVYSQASAPGLLLGTGNVGPHLEFGAEATCTFLSRDGGLSWEDVADHAAIYEFGARGGLLVRAAHATSGTPATAVFFSLDHGACWHKVPLPEGVAVDNIRAEPGGGGHTFFVHGMACAKTAAHPECSFTGGASPAGKMFVLDLKALMEGDWKECDASPESPAYEQWPLLRPDACLLGAKRSVTRRKRDAGCVDAAGWAPPPAPPPEPCDCSAEADTECEFGFERHANATCTAIPGLEPGACPGLGKGCYTISDTSLRLVHADVCAHPEAVFHDTNGRGMRGKGGHDDDRPRHGVGSDIRGLFIALFVGGILVTVAGVVWAQCLSADAQAAVRSAAAPVLGVLGAAAEAALGVVITVWDWARAKVGGLSARRNAEAAYFEPLTDSGPLDLDPEDHRSPPLFPGR